MEPTRSPSPSPAKIPSRLGVWSVSLAACGLVMAPVVMLEWNAERARWLAAAALELDLDGRRDEALQRLDQAVRLDPKSARLRSLRADLLAEMGRYRKALPDFDMAIELLPHSVSLRTKRADVYLEMGRGQAAVDDWKSVQGVPSSSYPMQDLLNGLAYTRARANLEIDAALQDVEKALAYVPAPEPGTPDALARSQYLDTRGFLRFLKKDWEGARSDLDEAVETYGQIWDGWDIDEMAKRTMDIRVLRREDQRLRHTYGVLLYHRSLVLDELDPTAAEADRRQIKQLLPEYDGRPLH